MSSFILRMHQKLCRLAFGPIGKLTHAKPTDDFKGLRGSKGRELTERNGKEQEGKYDRREETEGER